MRGESLALVERTSFFLQSIRLVFGCKFLEKKCYGITVCSLLYAKSYCSSIFTSQHRPCEINYHYELMKMIIDNNDERLGMDGFLFSLPIGDKPRGVKQMKQFVFKFLQDTSASLEVERIFPPSPPLEKSSMKIQYVRYFMQRVKCSSFVCRNTEM